MLRLGEIQTLVIVKKVEFGVYVAESREAAQKEKVLLPRKQVPENSEIGDSVEVFLYKDSRDRIIATTRKPAVTLHKTARLRVVEVGKIGAFLDWGLEKDLFLPFREQTLQIKKDQECLVALYVDKSERLCATMKVYEYLSLDSPYKKDDRVRGWVYEISRDFGAFVAVDDCYCALIPKKELYGEIYAGHETEARVTEVKPDGKLDLSVREKAYLQIGRDADRIMEVMEEKGGMLPFNDKADPELIRQEMQMSKNEFKRAVGHLLKCKKIVIKEKNIYKIES